MASWDRFNAELADTREAERAKRPDIASNDVKQCVPDTRPAKRIRLSSAEWGALREAYKHATCVTCGLAEPLELHHCVPRSQGGDDVEENLVPLCTRHHAMFESHAPGWEQVAGHVRAHVNARASRLSYVLNKIGQDRFDARYPCPPFLSLGDLDHYRSPDVWLRESDAVEGHEIHESEDTI